MNIYIQDEVLEFRNDSKKIEQLFSIINEYLQKEELQFSHLIIDGEQIYSDFYDYIIDNISNIEKVEVIALSIVEIVNESIISTEQYAKNAIPLINKIAQEFYQKPNENTWSQLADLFEGMQWIIQTLTQINSIECSNDIVTDYGIWQEYNEEVSKLDSIIPELDGAMLGKDNILIGDMLMFEVIPVFEAIIEKLGILIPKAVDNDAN